MGRPPDEEERVLAKDLHPVFERAGEIINRIRTTRDGVISVELDGEGGDDLFYFTGHRGAEIRRGKPPQGLTRVLQIHGNAGRLRAAIAKGRTPNEVLVMSGLEIRGSVDVAMQLVPHLLRLLAEGRKAQAAE